MISGGEPTNGAEPDKVEQVPNLVDQRKPAMSSIRPDHDGDRGSVSFAEGSSNGKPWSQENRHQWQIAVTVDPVDALDCLVEVIGEQAGREFERPPDQLAVGDAVAKKRCLPSVSAIHR
jgi:hypothetical protein